MASEIKNQYDPEILLEEIKASSKKMFCLGIKRMIMSEI